LNVEDLLPGVPDSMVGSLEVAKATQGPHSRLLGHCSPWSTTHICGPQSCAEYRVALESWPPQDLCLGILSFLFMVLFCEGLWAREGDCGEWKQSNWKAGMREAIAWVRKSCSKGQSRPQLSFLSPGLTSCVQGCCAVGLMRYWHNQLCNGSSGREMPEPKLPKTNSSVFFFWHLLQHCQVMAGSEISDAESYRKTKCSQGQLCT
jgi:hypothetical protein